MTRFAGSEIYKRRDSIFNNPGDYLNQEILPTTEGLSFPQDSRPASDFLGPNVDPTMIDFLRNEFMRNPRGGISRLPNFEEGPDQGPSTPIKWYPKEGGGPLEGNYREERAQLAPSMMDPYIDNDFIQDSGLPYIVGPEIERQRRDSMNQFQGIPPGLLPPNLRGV